jgi:hypothetical protein
MTLSRKKKTYYLTTDLDNAERARQTANGIGRELEIGFPKDLPLPPDASGVVVDADYLCLDARGRRQFFEELPISFPGLLVAVHSYDFDNERPTATAEGVVVARRFGPDLLLALEAQEKESEAA